MNESLNPNAQPEGVDDRNEQTINQDVDSLAMETMLPNAVRQYLNSIPNIPLLNAAQEVDIAKRMEAGLVAEQALVLRNAEDRDGAKVDLLQSVQAGKAVQFEGEPEREQAEVEKTTALIEQLADNRKRYGTETLEQLQADGKRAKDHLLTANLLLVVSFAKNYIGLGLPLLDLIQEGNLGLIRAAGKFDFNRGTKFSTYASRSIEGSIKRALQEKARIVRLPVYIEEEMELVRKTLRTLTTNLSREPTDDELITKAGITKEKLNELRSLRKNHLSLDEPIKVDGQTIRDISISETIEDPNTSDRFELIEAEVTQQGLAGVLPLILDRRARFILEKRFGGDMQYTYEEIGKELGISRESARLLGNKAMDKLREPKIYNLLHRHFWDMSDQ